MGKARTALPIIDEAGIRRVVRRIVDATAPIRIVLFGSHGRGDAGPDSDLDLFIEMNSDAPPRDRRLAIRRLLDDEGYPLDVVVMTPQEKEESRARPGSILSYIEAEGRVLYERG
jgi:predicted nucleotidyltransferase